MSLVEATICIKNSKWPLIFEALPAIFLCLFSVLMYAKFYLWMIDNYVLDTH